MNNEKNIGGQRIVVSDFKKLKAFKDNELARSIASKLVRDPTGTGNNGYNGTYAPPTDVIKSLSKNVSTNIEDFNNILQALPDTKIAMDIWTSCIISPKDGLTESLLWNIDNKDNEYSAKLFGEMLDALRDYFENDYDIFRHLRPSVEDALFKTGSYIIATIPESSIDDVINGKERTSNEAIIESIYKKDNGKYKIPMVGYLGPVKITGNQKVGLEGIIENATFKSNKAVKYHTEIHAGVTVVDNPDALKLSRLFQRIRKQNISKNIRSRYALEQAARIDFNDAADKLNDRPKQDVLQGQQPKGAVFDTKVKDSLAQVLYKDRGFRKQEIVTVRSAKDTQKLPIGKPLELKLPSTSVIPVHVPGNPRDIVGAFIILDEFGNPLDSSKYTDLFNVQRDKAQESVNIAGNIIRSMSLYDDKTCSTNETQGLNELARTYTSLFEKDLLTRLTNGAYGENIEISRPDEVYRIMFARALASMSTQLIYIPGELLTYFAFDFNRHGLGKSLLEDVRGLANMRVAMQYAQIYANVLNSIGRRKLILEVDELTPDPMKVIETLRAEFVRANAWTLPLLNEGPIDAINTLRESNIDVVIEGSSPALPTTKVEVEDTQTQRIAPEDDAIERVQKQYIQSFGLPVSIVDDTSQTEFATTAILTNTLFNKRAINYQNIYNTGFLYDLVSKHTLNNGQLIKRLSLIIKDNKDLLTEEQRALGTTFPIIDEFLSRLSVTLPTPDSKKVEDQNQDFSNYKSYVDNVVDNWLPDSVMEAALPENMESDKASLVKDTIKTILMSRYLNANGYLAELFTILDKDNADDNVEEEVMSYIKPVVKFAVDTVLTLDKLGKQENDPKLKEVSDNGEGGFGNTSSDSSTDDSTGDDDFGGFGDDGGDDAGDNLDDELPGGEDEGGEESSGDDDFPDEDLGF